KWRLRGMLNFVQNADIVDVLLVSARAPNGDVLGCLVTPGQNGLSTKRHKTIGGDVQCRVTFEDVEIADDMLVSPVDDDGLAYVSNAVTGLQCMEMLGGAQKALENTIGYVTVRHQFGRAIATFQALQHRVADMQIANDAARITAWQALASLALGKLSE